MDKLKSRFSEFSQKVKAPVKAYLYRSYVPSIGKWDTKQAKGFKYGIYTCIWISVFFWVVTALHLLYATKLFITYPMSALDNNYALELSILGCMYGCFALAFWGFQYVVNYYRSRWFDPDAKEIIDEQHYMKFHGWSHVVLALLMLLGTCLISLELLNYPNKDEMPKDFDQLKIAMILLVMIYGTCRLHASRFKELIDEWKLRK